MKSAAYAFTLALALAMAMATSVFGEAVELENFDRSAATYNFTLGQEYPGAAGTFAWTDEGCAGSARGCLRIDYDFTGGGNYIGWYYDGFFPSRMRQVEFFVRVDRPMPIALRVADATGQWHHFQSRVDVAESWQKMTFALPERSELHWGGKNDGVIHQPIGMIMVGIEKPQPQAQGTVFIDGLQAVSSLSTEEIRQARSEYYWKTATLDFRTAAPGILFYPSDKIVAEVALPQPVDDREITLSGKVVDAQRNLVAELPSVTISPKKALTTSLSLPSQLGFYYVVLKMSDGTHAKLSEGRYAVIPANPCLNEKESNSPFGVNTHFNQYWPAEIGVLVKRAGIGWIRDCEARPDDRAFPVAKANRLCYMPCFTMFRDPKNWLKKGADGKWDLSEAIRFHQEFARKYGQDVDYYDLVNEPQDAWAAKFGGNWSGGAWEPVFVEYGKTISDAIRQADPGAKVLWEDLDMLHFYRHYYDLGVAGSIDLISPHAYNLHPSMWAPEEQLILSQMAEFNQFVCDRKLPWRLWHGEVGFSSYRFPKGKEYPPTNGPCYYPASELEQAQRLVRMMVLHLSRGVERIFWYDFMNDGWEPENCEHNFGLIRADQTPKPAVVAYAFLIHQLRQSRWLGACQLGGGADAYAYAADRSDRPVLIAWVRRGQRVIDIRLANATTTKDVTITDIFGRSRTCPIVDGMLKVKLTETPVYIEGLSLADLQPFLAAR